MIASNETFVIAAYAVTWMVLLGYTWRLIRKSTAAGAARGHASDDSGGAGR